MVHAAEILEAALKLDPAERARLVKALAVSLDDVELGDEWEAEIRERASALDAGNVACADGEAVLARLERRFAPIHWSSRS